MPEATFRFYQELNDFLPPERRKIQFMHHFRDRASVKDMIERFGVPHTEIDLILVNGQSVDFSYIIQDKDYISVYPMFESIDITPLLKCRPQPLRETRFVLDVHLGKLAIYLRLMGFDAVYRNDFSDETLAEISVAEKRILLTRDRGLLKRKAITHGCFIRATQPKRQLKEVLLRFDLVHNLSPLKRCLRCNHLLSPVAKSSIVHKIPPRVQKYYDEFYRCTGCGQIYWKGTHWTNMQRFIEEITGAKASIPASEK
ncbi:Mut7-C ubiquitin/RNAse domain-containing protein [candidate division KSB1 bacterium]|nr:Mut7-C ubiquitin/RNAse domain-containing protein [candidate division KSB1 bacterium]